LLIWLLVATIVTGGAATETLKHVKIVKEQERYVAAVCISLLLLLLFFLPLSAFSFAEAVNST
jgi:hypothetical protein